MRAAIYRAMRFGIVGVVATATYVAVSFALLHVLDNAGIANFIALAVSLAVSYFGHHAFTFRSSGGGHARSLPRFLASSLVLMTAFSVLSHLYVDVHHGQKAVAIAFTALGYPGISFVVHSLWSFTAAPERKPVAD